MAVMLPALREHFAFCRVQGCKQRRGSVASIIVGHSLDVTQPQRQHRLHKVQRLNSALFIHAQNHSVFRGMQVQPYNISHFLDKKWIVRELELSLPVRLQSKGLPNAMHRRF